MTRLQPLMASLQKQVNACPDTTAMVELLPPINTLPQREPTHLLVLLKKFFVLSRSTILSQLNLPVLTVRLGSTAMRREWLRTSSLVPLGTTVHSHLNFQPNVL